MWKTHEFWKQTSQIVYHKYTSVCLFHLRTKYFYASERVMKQISRNKNLLDEPLFDLIGVVMWYPKFANPKAVSKKFLLYGQVWSTILNQ